MIAVLPYAALGLMRGPAVRELIGGSLFWESCIWFSWNVCPCTCGRPGTDLSRGHLGSAVG